MGPQPPSLGGGYGPTGPVAADGLRVGRMSGKPERPGGGAASLSTGSDEQTGGPFAGPELHRAGCCTYGQAWRRVLAGRPFAERRRSRSGALHLPCSAPAPVPGRRLAETLFLIGSEAEGRYNPLHIPATRQKSPVIYLLTTCY